MPSIWWPELRSGDLVSSLSDDEYARLLQSTSEWNLDPGDIVLKRGDPSASLVLIESGEIEVFDAMLGVTLARVGAGGVVGEVGFVDGFPRTHDVRAASSCRLRHLTRDKLLELVQGDPQLFAKLTIGLAELLANRFRSALADLEPIRAFASSLEPAEVPADGPPRFDELEIAEDAELVEIEALDLIKDVARASKTVLGT